MAAHCTGVAAAGDEAGRLYAEYGRKLHRFCLGRLRSAEEAEDAVQTTFLRVYTALRQGTVPQYEAAWLYKIAHNVCLSRIESSARRARLESPQDFSLLEDELAAPTGRTDELVGLADALAAMPANLRQAILLREWQGLSYAEIAEALDVSVSAVESLIFRARRQLAHALVEPAKRVAGALNLPWIAGGIRTLLAGFRGAGTGAGIGTKVLAGAALLAVGGGGAGLGLTVGSSGHQRRPVVTVQPVAATLSAVAGGSSAPAGTPAVALVAVAGSLPNATTSRRPGAKAVAGAVAGTGGTRRTGRRRLAPLTPGRPAVPGTSTAPGVPAPTGADPPAITTPPRTGTTTPSPTGPRGEVTVGPVSTPAVTIAVPTVPGLPTVPPVTVPSVTVPPVTVPPVTVPPVTVPPVTTPTLPAPVPTVTVPGITTPTITLPRP